MARRRGEQAMSDLGDAAERLGSAMHTLVCGSGDLRSRVLGAWTSCHALRPEDLPGAVGEELRGIHAELTRYGETAPGMGTVHGTLERLTDSDVQVLAERIWKLHEAVRDLRRLSASQA
jgi:hypothetical protein